MKYLLHQFKIPLLLHLVKKIFSYIIFPFHFPHPSTTTSISSFNYYWSPILFNKIHYFISTSYWMISSWDNLNSRLYSCLTGSNLKKRKKIFNKKRKKYFVSHSSHNRRRRSNKNNSAFLTGLGKICTFRKKTRIKKFKKIFSKNFLKKYLKLFPT